MFLDQENLRPVIIAMALWIAIVSIVPKVVKKSTGIQPIDELVMYIMSQKDSMMQGTLLIGLIVLATNYIGEELM
jgi:hypothetical protein